MPDILKGKVAVVTGSGRGIGKAAALAMAREGARVVINDLGCTLEGSGNSGMVADETVSEIKNRGGAAVASYDTVATSEGADGIIKTAVDNFGRIDILVNNAGIDRETDLWDMKDEDWDAVLKTNLYGTFYCTRAAANQMKKAVEGGDRRGGRIINISSHAGIQGNPGRPGYSAAKAGVIGFTFSCALALCKYGITCNAVAPHAYSRFAANDTDDGIRQLAIARNFPGAATASIEEIKEKFLGPPEVIAPLLCWLASDYAGKITGQVFMARRGQVGLFSGMSESRMAFKDGIFDLDEIIRIMPSLTGEIKPPPDWK